VLRVRYEFEEQAPFALWRAVEALLASCRLAT
jgi:hypothetical protein